MPDAINEKPFVQIAFTLGANARLQYETSSGACLYFAEGPGIMPGAISWQLDENDAFRVAVGLFMRVEKFDKLRLINNTAVPVTGLIYISANPNFLAMMFPMGI